MTRAGDKLYDLGPDPTPRGCQYVIGFLLMMGLLAAAAPLVRWASGLAS